MGNIGSFRDKKKRGGALINIRVVTPVKKSSRKSVMWSAVPVVNVGFFFVVSRAAAPEA